MDTLEHRTGYDEKGGPVYETIHWKGLSPEQIRDWLYPNAKLEQYTLTKVLSMDARATYVPAYQVLVNGSPLTSVLVRLDK